MRTCHIVAPVCQFLFLLLTLSTHLSTAYIIHPPENDTSKPTIGTAVAIPVLPYYIELEHKHQLEKDDPDGLPTLSSLLYSKIFEPYAKFCNASVLSIGDISLMHNLENTTIYRNYSLIYPSLIVQCSNISHDGNDSVYHHRNNNFTAFLSEFALNFTLNRTKFINNVQDMVHRDDFDDSILLIAFLQTAICVWVWMVFLILLLLPSSNYNNQNYLVHLYVIVYAIVNTVYLHKGNQVFEQQYIKNTQDSRNYENAIIRTDGYRIMMIVVNIISNINWVYIVFYLFDTDMTDDNNNVSNMLLNDKSRQYLTHIKSFIHKCRRTKYFWTLLISTLLVISDNVFSVLLIYDLTLKWGVYIYRVTDLISIILLSYVIWSFIIKNFGFTITQNTVNGGNDNDNNRRNGCNSNTDLSVFHRIKIIWKDYHTTIPLIIYNIVVLLLYFSLIIYFVTQNFYHHRWKYNILYFLKLIITVNFWGLLGALKEREQVLNNKTVVGRQINNRDKFFLDPTSDYNLGDDEDFESVENHSHDHLIPKLDTPHGQHNLAKRTVMIPFKLWQSKISRAKDRRRQNNIIVHKQTSLNIVDVNTSANVANSRGKHNSLLTPTGSIAGQKNHKNKYRSSHKKKSKSNTHHIAVLSDDDSMDTELESNYIFGK